MTQFATPRPEPKHDWLGRYLLPDPDTGREQAYTRVTTFVKAVADTYNLEKWKMRMVAKGIATRSDLYALAASTQIENKKAFEKITEDALEAAKASTGRNLGTALHAFTEQLDLGQDVAVPQPWDRDIAAYRATLTAAGIIIIPELIERVVLIPTYGIAGKLDRVVQLADGTCVIADVKTGSIEYGTLEIAVQLACYAYAAHMATPDYKRWEPMPKVDPNRALVIHLPAGQGRCDLYDVDIVTGWETAYLCRLIRDLHTRKDLLSAHTAGFPEPPPMADPLLAQIAQAGDRAAMEALWKHNAREWTPVHTKAAGERLAALRTTVGHAGGTQERETASA